MQCGGKKKIKGLDMYMIRDSVDVQFTKAPAIAIAGPSGCGKTESAMRLARGYCGPGEKFVIIDTEEKRALYKKGRYQPWDWIDFQPPFTPENCRDVLDVAKGYKAVIWDSGSSEYVGEGGLQDIADDTLERMSGGNAARMEALVAPSWKDAKRRHKLKLMSYLIRYPTLLIVCLRAEPKVKFVKVFDEKKGREVTQIVDAGFQPLCEKMFMYEMLVGCKMAPDKAGVPEHIKKLEPDLEPVFLADKQIDEATGKRLAIWTQLRRGESVDQPADPVEYINDNQVADLKVMLIDHGIATSKLLGKVDAATVERIPLIDYDRCIKWVQEVVEARKDRKATS